MLSRLHACPHAGRIATGHPETIAWLPSWRIMRPVSLGAYGTELVRESRTPMYCPEETLTSAC